MLRFLLIFRFLRVADTLLAVPPDMRDATGYYWADTGGLPLAPEGIRRTCNNDVAGPPL